MLDIDEKLIVNENKEKNKKKEDKKEQQSEKPKKDIIGKDKIAIIMAQNDKMKAIIDNITLREQMETLMKKKKNKKIAENISKIIL